MANGILSSKTRPFICQLIFIWFYHFSELIKLLQTDGKTIALADSHAVVIGNMVRRGEFHYLFVWNFHYLIFIIILVIKLMRDEQAKVHTTEDGTHAKIFTKVSRLSSTWHSHLEYFALLSVFSFHFWINSISKRERRSEFWEKTSSRLYRCGQRVSVRIGKLSWHSSHKCLWAYTVRRDSADRWSVHYCCRDSESKKVPLVLV